MGILDRLGISQSRIDERLAELRSDSEGDKKASDILAKAEDDLSKIDRTKYRYQRASLVDPAAVSGYGEGGFGLYRPRQSYLSNKQLKEMTLRDPIVSAIFQTRINQVARFSRPQENRYEPGFRVVPRDPSVEVEPGSKEEGEIAWLIDYVKNCGSNEDRDPKSKMDFDTWLRLVVRDRLTIGSIALETIRNHVGGIHSFLPAPTESIYFANKALPAETIEQAADAQKQAVSRINASKEEIEAMMEHEEQRDRQRDEGDEIEFVQVLNGRVTQTFTRKEMIYKLGNPQNFIDVLPYCISETEMATLAITAHLQAEEYVKKFFTHGFASRGLLHIAGDISPAQLQAFRSAWAAQISNVQNSWRTPIIAGVDSVEWIPLSPSNRDMEYTQYVDHIIRTICSIFSISPIEIGFDYLTKGQGSGGLGQEDNEVKIEQSQVRGLKPLLVWIETIINEDILPNVSEDFAARYKFQFVGLDIESKEQEIARQTSETAIRSTINDIRRESGQDPILGGDIVLNPLYWQALIQTHKIGEIREFLFGYGGDAENPEYNYISDPNYLANLQLILQMQQQAMAAEVQSEGQQSGFEEGEDGPVDEDGFPIPEEEAVDENGEPIEDGAPPEDDAPPEPPVKKSRRQVITSAGLLRKASKQGWSTMPLAKANVVTPHQHGKAKVLDGELERARKSYLEAYKRIEDPLIRGVLGTLKGLGDDEDSEG